MDNPEIRRKILEYIYSKNEQQPLYMAQREEVKQFLNVSDAKLDNNVLYLESKGYLKVGKSIGSIFVYAQITSDGIDLVENPEQLNTMFPVSIIQNIIQHNTGVIIGDHNIQKINITDSFIGVYREINEKNPNNKQQIIIEVKKIEEELKKPTPNKTIIDRSIEFLKNNASWIVPTLIDIIRKTIGV